MLMKGALINRRRLLIVDDQLEVRTLLRRALEGSFEIVCEVRDG
jgi:hypothetical protein